MDPLVFLGSNTSLRHGIRVASSPSFPMDIYDRDIRLPVELWLEVLSYSSTSSIGAVAGTCSALRWLAQPLLFKTFIVRLDGQTCIHKATNIRRDVRPTNTRERLMVLGYPHIARAITEMRIISTPSSSWYAEPIQSSEPSHAKGMIDTIFKVLPNLANLRRLVCRDILFTKERLDTLRRVSQLKDLELQSCHTTCPTEEFPDFSIVQLERLIFDYPYTSLDFHRNYRFLALFLQSRNLKHLYAGPANDILLAITQTLPPDTLTTLEIPVSCISSPVFVPALSCCPTVKELSLYMAIGNNRLPRLDHLPTYVLPNLQSYRGPRSYSLLFAATRAITHIEFALPCHPADLCQTILDLDNKDAIESLACKINTFDPSLLKTIHNTLPTLKHLDISGVAVDFDSMASAFSGRRINYCGLQSIILAVHTGVPRLTDSWRSTVAKMFLTLLIHAYPELQAVKLVYQPHMSVVWNRSNAHEPAVVDVSQMWVEKQEDLEPRTNAVWDILKLER